MSTYKTRTARQYKPSLKERAARLQDLFYAGVGSKRVAFSVLAACAAGMVVAPHAAIDFALAGIVAAAAHMVIRKPVKVDKKALMMMGHDHYGKEIWITEGNVCQHMVVLGKSGAKKTNGLLGLVENALSWGSGAVFIDGKGDANLIDRVQGMARQYGREDDVLVLDFTKRSTSSGQRGGHTINPFASENPDVLVNIVFSMWDSDLGYGEGWTGRIFSILHSVLSALVWLRDNKNIALSIGVLSEHLSLASIIDLSSQTKFPDMPDDIRKGMLHYLNTIPGFDPEKGYRQAQVSVDQHEQIEMILKKIVGDVFDAYAGLFHTTSPEVYMRDVVLNRRILIIQLPDVKKSGEEAGLIGRMILGTLKTAISVKASEAAKGDFDTFIPIGQGSPFPSPFLMVFDDVDHYTVESMSVFYAMARYFGLGLFLSSEDVPSFKLKDEKEASAVLANSNIKAFMGHSKHEELSDSGSSFRRGDTDHPGIIIMQHGEKVVEGTLPTRKDDFSRDRKPEAPRNHFIMLRPDTSCASTGQPPIEKPHPDRIK